jgi:hypothetical protein
MSFTKTTPLGARMLIGSDWHELYCVMPGECLEPWMCPLVPADECDKRSIRFLKQTGLENFYWVPCPAPPIREVPSCFASDEAAMRFL